MLLLPYDLSLWLSTLLYLVSLPVLTAYALRLYVFSAMFFMDRGEPAPEVASHGDPLVSVLLPLYNEEKVVDRLMRHCTSFLHDDYEVIVIDDSTDSTTERLRTWARDGRVKVLHRPSRSGWKAGALNEGLKHVSAGSKYCLVLDSDSLPPPDLIDRYLKKFEETGADVVQGAQRTDLNSGESWVARATSLMLDGFNFVELWAKQELGLVIPITGSNFMARTEVLRRYGFDEDIAEDWSMTARLWGDGVGVVYDQTIVVRSESPPSLVAAIRQFSRWAEGTIRVTVRRAALVASSKAMTLRQKLDFFMSGFSYFTSVLFILIIAGGILMPVPAFSTPPTPFLFWGTVVGLTGLPALPISLITARRASGTRVKASTVLFALLEGYLIFPFTAYAALRGLFRGRGSFQRTAKTGWMEGSG